jgi:hypothetical protein
MSDPPAVRDLLGADAPSNWGKQGPDGELGYDGKLWNGYDARSTIRVMHKAFVLPVGENGVVGRVEPHDIQCVRTG